MKSMKSKDCLFCKIVGGEIPSKKVFESEKTLAFLDIMPLTKGHTVVVPKTHCYNLLDISESDIEPFFKDLKKIAALLKEKLNMDGFNIIQNNFPAGGQVVDHFHYHIIPRMEGDKVVKLKHNTPKAEDAELNEVLEILK
jgi:histidine triad (HIT) family protein